MSHVLSDAEREALRDRIRREGEPALIRVSGVSRNALVRAVAGLPSRLGTLALIRDALSAESRAA